MSPKLQILLRIAIFIIIIFFFTKPYNLFCNLSQKCQPFYFSYLIPAFEGENQINISFKVTNYHENLDFSVSNPEIETFTNRLNTFKFKVKNNSQRKLTFKPELMVVPEEYRKYIKLYQCLCSSKHSLDPLEEREMQMVFSIDDDFDDLASHGYELENKYNNPLLVIRYKIENKRY